MKFIFAFILALLSLTARGQGLYYPPYYTTLWGTAAGVQGGIPTGQTVYTTILSTNNTTDRSATIQSFLNACPSGQIVMLGIGPFYFGTVLTIPSGVILSGNGWMLQGNNYNTVMECTIPANTSPAIYAGTSANTRAPHLPFVNASSVTSSVVAGTTVLTIADTTDYTAGQLLRFSCTNQSNNAGIQAGAVPVIMITGFYNSRIHIARIVSKTATTLTISPGLLWDSTGLSPIVQPMNGCSTGVGIQHMEIDCTGNGSGGAPLYGIEFESCQSSWIYDVKITQAASYSVFLVNDFQITMKHSFLNKAGSGGTNGSGLLLGSQGDGANFCLFEDNIMYQCYPSTEMNYGIDGCVFSYNYCYDNTLSGAAIGPSIDTNHGPHNSFNLYESNVAANFQADGFFGSVSEDTLSRNWLTSTSPGATPRSPVLMGRFTRRYALVGNILGTTGVNVQTYLFGLPNMGNTSFTGTAEPTTGDFWTDWKLTGTLTTRTNNTDGVVTATGSIGSFATGYNLASLTWSGTGLERLLTVSDITGLAITFNTGSGTALPSTSTAMNLWPGVVDSFQEKDLDVQNSAILKGNYNTQDGAIPANESLGTQVIPASYYLSEKPTWFGYLTYPAYDSSNPNFSTTAIPAGYRYVFGMDPPAVLLSGAMSGSAKISGSAVIK